MTVGGTPRDRTEQIERETLSSRAVLAADSKGREREEQPHPLRTAFQRDRDRILHSKAFRRLKHKTQVFLAPEGDHYRVRLTHTLEVSQIARTAARVLRLNEDLTEAIALGHDLGHTPFGHLGEEALSPFLPHPFRHNEQSLRIVDFLENDGRGLNLTWEVRDGILNHPWSTPLPSTLEAQVVRFSDRIAYVNHDVDDALRAGVLRPEDLPADVIGVLGETHSDRVDTLVGDLTAESWDREEIRMSEPVLAAMTGLREFLFERVYLRGEVREEHEKAVGVVRALFAYYLDHPEQVPAEHLAAPGDVATHVADYIAGMTDRFALRAYEQLFLPSDGSCKEPGERHVPGRINPEDKDNVRERSDIVKVVSGYLQLKKTGRDSFSGICPFHQEKTPSFTVSPSKQVFYCFGCGEGGDVIKFVERVESLTFAEAVERLAEQAGVRLRYEGQSSADRKVAGRRQALHRANAEAGALFHRMLLDGKEAAEARAYLASRGVTPESVEKFAVGYAPGYQDFLLRRLSGSFGPELLVEAGLVARDGQSTLRDRFRGRVTFPIHDVSGNAVGFGGRLLQPKDRPEIQAAKYVNSSDSPVYHKSTLLYNLHRAKGAVAGDRRAFLVEGYTDVIALDQVGVPEVVATCGTALGEDHVRVLSRFTDRLVLSFDSDEAGARAAERAFQFHQQYAVDFLVLVLPEGQDPADFVLARGAEAGEAFRALAERAVPLVEYMLHRLMAGRALETPEDRARAVRESLAVLARLEDPVRRQQYVPLVADLAGVTSGSVALELERLGSHGAPDAAAGRAPATRMSPAQQVEREALKLLVRSPDIRSARLAALDPTRFSTATLRKAFDFLREAPAGADVAGLVSLAEERSDALAGLVSSLALEPLKVGEPPAADAVEAVFLRLDEFGIRRQADALRKELQPLNPLKDRETYDALFKRLVALEGERRRLREQAEGLESGDSDL